MIGRMVLFGVVLLVAVAAVLAMGARGRETGGIGAGRQCYTAVLSSLNLVTGNYRHAAGETAPGDVLPCAAFMDRPADAVARAAAEVDLAARRVPGSGAVRVRGGGFEVLLPGPGGELLEYDGSRLRPWEGR